MSRQVRVEYAGEFYHVMARGDRGESGFADGEERGADAERLEPAVS